MEVQFGEFTGINNVQSDFHVKSGRQGALVEATNVDINDVGKLQRRTGFDQIVSATGAHSVFAGAGICLYRHEDKLIRLFEDFSLVDIKTGLTVDAAMYYEEGPDRVFMSDGVEALWTDGEVVRRWGVEPPVGQPDAAQAAAGALPPGKYLYAVTFCRADGEESGTGLSGWIECERGIDFTNIPVSPASDVATKRIYLSMPNGLKMFQVIEIANATTSASYTGNLLAGVGPELTTQFKIPPPPGRCLALHHGRMLVGFGSFLLFSDAYRHELFDHEQAYALGGILRFVKSLPGGAVVGTDKAVIWMSGADAEDFSPTIKARYGVIPGSAVEVDADEVNPELSGKAVLFASTKGICLVTEDGAFRNLTSGTYEYSLRPRAAALFRRLSKLSSYTLVMR